MKLIQYISTILLLSIAMVTSASEATAQATVTLAAESPSSVELVSLGDRLTFVVVGSVIVLGTLFVLMLVCMAIGKIFILADQRKVARTAQPLTAIGEMAEASTPQSDEPEVIAAIAAAVAITLQQPSRMISVRQIASSAWSQVGRKEHFDSHRVR